MSVRRSMGNLLGSDPDFEAFAIIAQKVFGVSSAAVVMLQEGMSRIDRYRPSAAAKGGIIDRVKYDAESSNKDPSSRFYAIFPQGSDVCVIEDCQADPQVKDSPFVTGSPFIRFYAGAALTVDGTKVGALVLIDTEKRKDFNDVDKSILLDLSAAIASMIKERNEAHTVSNHLSATMMVRPNDPEDPCGACL
jgi:GAF domain-containing protein